MADQELGLEEGEVLGGRSFASNQLGGIEHSPKISRCVTSPRYPRKHREHGFYLKLTPEQKLKKTFNLCVLSLSVSPHLKIVLRSTEEAQLGVRKEILWVWHAKGSPSAARRTLPCGRSARRSSPDVWCQRLIASISADSKSNISSWMALEALGCFISKAVLFGLEVCENRW